MSLDTLLESGRLREPARVARGVGLAVTAHVALVALAIHTTRAQAGPPRAVLVPLVVEWPEPGRARHRRPEAVVPPAPVPPAPLVVDSGLPPIPPLELPPPVTWPASGGEPAGGPPSPPGGAGSAPLAAALADVPPVLLAGPPVTYPERLRQAGIDGVVLLEAVVDTSGHVEPGSVRVVSSPHAELARAATMSLERAVFRPARVGKRAVRVLVRLPVAFHLTRRGARAPGP